MSGQPAARLGDDTEHSNALLGLLAGAVVGLGVGIALVAGGAATALTGGLAAPLLVAAVGTAMVVGSGAGLAGLGRRVGSLIPSSAGKLVSGCPTVFVNARPAARSVVDFSLCTGPWLLPPHHKQSIATGSGTVLIGGFPAAREKDHMECSAKIAEGSANVIIGGETVLCLPIRPEVPAWVDPILKYATWGSALILLPFAPGMIIGGFLGGKIMGAVGKELGGAIFGDGSNGQAWTELGFETAGMFIGSKVGNSIAPPPLTNRLMNADVNQAGWPTLPGKQAVNFSNVEPVTLQPGTKIYRIIESQEGANGSYWARDLPTSKSQWRSDYAVSEQWNKDGQYVEYTVTEPLQVWEGGAAPQLVGTEYLPGGANQIWLPKGTVTPGEPVSTGW